MSKSFVAFSGSRHLPAAWSFSVHTAVRSVLKSGRGIITGCCAGLDAQVIQACLMNGAADRLMIFAVGAPDLTGFPEGITASLLVKAAERAGATVHWFAGGPLSAPLTVRLADRTKRAVWAAAASGQGAGLIAFHRAPGRGTRLAMRTAAEAGLPVIALPTDPTPLPELGKGRWVKAGCWGNAMRWEVTQ